MICANPTRVHLEWLGLERWTLLPGGACSVERRMDQPIPELALPHCGRGMFFYQPQGVPRLRTQKPGLAPAEIRIVQDRIMKRQVPLSAGAMLPFISPTQARSAVAKKLS